MTQGAAQHGMVLRWLAAVVILPVMVLVVIPAAILLLCGDTQWAHANAGPATAQFWGAIPLAVIGLVLTLWTVALFVRFGEGTAAPWDPPGRFIVRGPYRLQSDDGGGVCHSAGGISDVAIVAAPGLVRSLRCRQRRLHAARRGTGSGEAVRRPVRDLQAPRATLDPEAESMGTGTTSRG